MLNGDFDTLLPGGGLSRWALARPAVGAGIAAAVLPAMAQAAVKSEDRPRHRKEAAEGGRKRCPAWLEPQGAA